MRITQSDTIYRKFKNMQNLTRYYLWISTDVHGYICKVYNMQKKL